MANIFKRTFQTTREIAVVTTAAVTQTANVYNDGWTGVKNHHAWTKRIAEHENGFKNACNAQRATDDNNRVVDVFVDAYNGTKTAVTELVG